MKRCFTGSARFSTAIMTAVLLATVIRLDAATFYWDSDGASGSGTDASGTWDISSQLWHNGSVAGTLETWNNNTPSTSQAVFGGASGTVTLASGSGLINVNRIAFADTSGFTIAGQATGTYRLAFSGANPTIDTGAYNATISATIAGNATVTKIGTGTLTLTGNSSSNTTGWISGGLTIEQGIVEASGFSALGQNFTSITTTLKNNSTLRFINTASEQNYSRRMAIDSTGGRIEVGSALVRWQSTDTLTSNSDSVLTITGQANQANSQFRIERYTPGIKGTLRVTGDTGTGPGFLQIGNYGGIVPNATLQVDAGSKAELTTLPLVGALTGSGTLNSVGGTRYFSVGDNRTTTYEFSGVLAGSTSLTKTGSSTFRISGSANTYTGNTVVRGGTLLVGGNVASGAVSTLGNASAAIQLGDTTTRLADVQVATNGNAVGGTFSNGTFTGVTATIDGYTLELNDRVLVKNQDPGTGQITGQNGVYQVTSITSGQATLSRVDITTNGVHYGKQVKVLNGAMNAGTYWYVGTADALTLNTGTGNSGVNWQLDREEASNGSPNVALLTDGAYTIARNIDVVNNNSSGSSTLGGSETQTASSTFSGNIALNKQVQLTSSTAAGNAVNFTGAIGGVGGITKIGSGTVRLTGNNTFTGSTDIKNGTLSLTDDGKLGSGNISIAAGATLDISGITANSFTLASGRTLSGDGTIRATGKTLQVAGGLSASHLTVLGNLQLTSTAQTQFNIDGPSSDQLTVNDTLTYGGALTLRITSLAYGTYDLFTFSNYDGALSAIYFTDAYSGEFISQGNGIWVAQLGQSKLTFTESTGDLTITSAIPEPITAGPLAAGVAGLLLRRHQQHR